MSAVAVQAPIAEEIPETMNEKTMPIEPETQPAAAPISSSRDYRTAEDEPGNTKTVPYGAADPSAQPAPSPELTDEQTAKYNELLELCKTITEVPIAKNKQSEKSPLTESDRMFMTKECLLRYLKATKWVVSEAKKRIEGTLTWKREWGLESHTAEHVEPESNTGKIVLFGFDKEGRPCMYLNPAKQNTARSIRQLHQLTFMLERVLDLTGPGVETLALLVDFKSASSGQNASLEQGRMTMEILQMHYPERLGKALVVNIPWWANLFLKAIYPFIDPITRVKLKFNEDLSNYVPKSHLLKEFNGDIDFTYDHAAYWPNFIKLCNERRQKYEERWKANGSQIGESEFYLKGGEKSKPLTPTAEPTVEQVTDEIQKVTV
ncbi:Patellin-5 [Dactylella cylindrospora]|nr:Patellin-5 [Dactylella cylindrospora]